MGAGRPLVEELDEFKSLTSDLESCIAYKLI